VESVKKLLNFSAVSLVFFAGVFAALSLAPKASLAQGKEIMAFSYGTVLDISKNQIVVSEYDYDKDEESEASYVIDRKTEFKNVKSATDIVAGDSADIVYVISDGERVAQSISIERQANDEEVDLEDSGIEPAGENSLPPSAIVTENKI